jgi:hypothetical protein
MMRMKVDLNLGFVQLDTKLTRAVLRSAGGEIAQVARSLIKAKVDGKKRISTPGQPPVSRSGLLAASIRTKSSRNGMRVSIIDKAYYSLFLEAGARGGGGNANNARNILLAGERNGRGKLLRGRNRMKKSAIDQTRVLLPHPFLSLALEQRGASVVERIKASIVTGVKFVRVKP